MGHNLAKNSENVVRPKKYCPAIPLFARRKTRDCLNCALLCGTFLLLLLIFVFLKIIIHYSPNPIAK